jgi:hypothetical protein
MINNKVKKNVEEKILGELSVVAVDGYTCP